MNKTNEEIRDWEIRTHEEIGDIDKWLSDKNIMRLFNSMLFYNKQFIDFLVKFYSLENKKILDYGCGSGAFANLFQVHSQEVYGCDISKNFLEYAKIKNKEVKFFEDDFFHSSLKENTYDFIFCRNLGPLQKIDYNKENVDSIKSIISSLSENGVGYFTFTGDLSGNPGNRVSGFQNHSLKSIYDFFSGAGHISMVNVFGYQALIITKSIDLAQKYRDAMNNLIHGVIYNLGPFDYVNYLKGKLWLYVNGNFNSVKRDEFKFVDEYIQRVYSKKLVKSLCKSSDQKISFEKIPSNFFLISGDHDKYFSYHFSQELSFHKMKVYQIFKNYGKKFLKK